MVEPEASAAAVGENLEGGRRERTLGILFKGQILSLTLLKPAARSGPTARSSFSRKLKVFV